eukprot:scaffold27329_cov63-Phaeocystis_antarctica.AAC.2
MYHITAEPTLFTDTEVQSSSGRWRSMEPASACGQAEGAGALPCGLCAACIGDGLGRLLLASTHSLAGLPLPPPVSSPPPSPRPA